jgi:hypothetical protein
LEAEHAVEAILFINAVTAWRNVSIFSEWLFVKYTNLYRHT